MHVYYTDLKSDSCSQFGVDGDLVGMGSLKVGVAQELLQPHHTKVPRSTSGTLHVIQQKTTKTGWKVSFHSMPLLTISCTCTCIYTNSPHVSMCMHAYTHIHVYMYMYNVHMAKSDLTVVLMPSTSQLQKQRMRL